MLTLPCEGGVEPAAARRNELRARIIEAARRLCFGRGPEAVSTRKIATAVGCSPTAIYLHFDSIEHVLHELRMEGHAELAGYLRRPAATMHAAKRLCAMQREYYRFGCDQPHYFRLMFMARINTEGLGELAKAESATLDIVREAARTGLAAGQIRSELDADVIANLTWMSVHGLTSTVVTGHAPVTASASAGELLARLCEATYLWLTGRPTPPPSEVEA